MKIKQILKKLLLAFNKWWKKTIDVICDYSEDSLDF